MKLNKKNNMKIYNLGLRGKIGKKQIKAKMKNK
jgi:hypothetical protein